MLLINSKSAAKFELINIQSGDGLRLNVNQHSPFVNSDVEKFFIQTRNLSFYRQNKARKILITSKTKNNKNWSVCYCLRARANLKFCHDWNIQRKMQEVHIRLNNSRQRAYYGGLLRCGSVWVCPVCQGKIMYVRSQQVQSAINKALDINLDCFMFTYTFRHNKNQKLKDTLDNFMNALRSFKASRNYKAIMQSIGCKGSIRSLEVTFSQKNGFHPHTHELIFTKYNYSEINNMYSFINNLRTLWIHYCEKNNLLAPNFKRSINVSYQQNKEKIGRYLAKCNVSKKTSLNIKSNPSQSLSPFNFLDLSKSNDDEYAALYREYAIAIQGKSQLYHSRGLKQMLDIEDITDKDIVDKDLKNSQQVFVFSGSLWKRIIDNKEDIRGQILNHYELGGSDAVQDFLTMKKIQTH